MDYAGRGDFRRGSRGYATVKERRKEGRKEGRKRKRGLSCECLMHGLAFFRPWGAASSNGVFECIRNVDQKEKKNLFIQSCEFENMQ